MTEEMFKKIHGFDDEDFEFIKRVVKSTKGTITSITGASKPESA